MGDGKRLISVSKQAQEESIKLKQKKRWRDAAGEIFDYVYVRARARGGGRPNEREWSSERKEVGG